MIARTNLQTLPLDSLVPGLTYLLVITNSPGANTLKFQHLDNPTTAAHPAHVGVVGATVVTTFLCPAPVMALVFAAPPAQDYYVSVLPLASPEF